MLGFQVYKVLNLVLLFLWLKEVLTLDHAQRVDEFFIALNSIFVSVLRFYEPLGSDQCQAVDDIVLDYLDCSLLKLLSLEQVQVL